MNKVLITGSNGFIGSRLTAFLANHGVHVIALDVSDSNLPKSSMVQYVQTDLGNREALNQLCWENVDVLYHLAWRGVGADQRSNYDSQIMNISYSLNTLSLAKRLDIPKAVLLGSVAEFSLNKQPISGRDIPTPVDAYGATKAACRILCTAYAKQNCIPLIWGTVSSVYGPGRDDNNILSYAIKSLLTNKEPVFTKLEQKWDFIYIEDLLEALYLIGRKGLPGKSYGVGSGEDRPLYDYITALRDSIDPMLPLGIGKLPYKAGVPDNSVIDTEELLADTGFIAKVPFSDGIEKTIKSFKDQYLHDRGVL